VTGNKESKDTYKKHQFIHRGFQLSLAYKKF